MAGFHQVSRPIATLTLFWSLLVFSLCIMSTLPVLVAFHGRNREKYFHSIFLEAYSILHFNLVCIYN